MAKTDPSAKWLGSLTKKILAVTAAVTALAALVNGVIDLYQKVANVPTNVYDRTNDQLFRKNFSHQPPLVSQPVLIKSANVTVEMLLQVYDTGDVFVRYGDFQQWLPFKALKTARLSLVADLLAQGLPTIHPQLGAIVVDIEQLKKLAKPEDGVAIPLSGVLDKSYVLAKVKEDHPGIFSPSIETFTESHPAEKGYKITKFDFQLGSANHAQVQSKTLAPDGSKVTVVYSLTSGPLVDQYRAWIQATLKTTQEKVAK
jgi:hypothetical protein